VRSDAGREATLHPYRQGHYLGSGQGEVVLAEAGLDGVSQFHAIKKYLNDVKTPVAPNLSSDNVSLTGSRH
jgi:hypothetical protein